jgi:hypothetical protein
MNTTAKVVRCVASAHKMTMLRRDHTQADGGGQLETGGFVLHYSGNHRMFGQKAEWDTNRAFAWRQFQRR